MKLKDFNDPFREFLFLIDMNSAREEFEKRYRPSIQAMTAQLAADAGNIKIDEVDSWVSANDRTWEVTPSLRLKMLDVCECIIGSHSPQEYALGPWEPTMDKFQRAAATLREEIAGNVVVHDAGYEVHDRSYTTIETLYLHGQQQSHNPEAKVSAVERGGVIHAAVTVDLSEQHNVLIRLTDEAAEDAGEEPVMDLSGYENIEFVEVELPEIDLSAPANPSVVLDRRGGGMVRMDVKRKVVHVVPGSNTLGDLPPDMARAIEIKLQAMFDEFLDSLPRE